MLENSMNSIPATVLNSGRIENQRRFYTLLFLMIIASLFLLLFAGVTFYQKAYFLSIVDFSLAVSIVGLMIMLFHKVDVKDAATVMVSFLSVYFYYLFFNSGLGGSTWVWYFTIPLWAIFLTGKKQGVITSFILLFVTIVTYFFKKQTGDFVAVDGNLLLRFIGVYICILTVSYAMEDTREKTFKKLEDSNDTLHNVVQELEEAKKKYQELSSKDSMTLVYSHKVFVEDLKAVINQPGSELFSVLFVDIDDFSKFNDLYGREMGDMVLKTLAKDLSFIIKKEGGELYRYGGGVFSAILLGKSEEDNYRIIDKLLTTVRQLQIKNDNSSKGIITISGGLLSTNSKTISSYSFFIQDLDDLLKKAKDSGKDRIEYLLK